MHNTHAAVNEMFHRIMTESVPQGLWALFRGLWWVILIAIIVLFIKSRMDRADRERAKQKRRAERDEEYRRMAKILKEETDTKPKAPDR